MQRAMGPRRQPAPRASHCSHLHRAVHHRIALAAVRRKLQPGARQQPGIQPAGAVGSTTSLRVADDRDRGSRRTQIPRSRLPHFGLQRSRKAAPSPAGPCRPWPSSQQAPHEAIIDVIPAMTTDAPRSARARPRKERKMCRKDES